MTHGVQVEPHEYVAQEQSTTHAFLNIILRSHVSLSYACVRHSHPNKWRTRCTAYRMRASTRGLHGHVQTSRSICVVEERSGGGMARWVYCLATRPRNGHWPIAHVLSQHVRVSGIGRATPRVAETAHPHSWYMQSARVALSLHAHWYARLQMRCMQKPSACYAHIPCTPSPMTTGVSLHSIGELKRILVCAYTSLAPDIRKNVEHVKTPLASYESSFPKEQTLLRCLADGLLAHCGY